MQTKNLKWIDAILIVPLAFFVYLGFFYLSALGCSVLLGHYSVLIQAIVGVILTMATGIAIFHKSPTDYEERHVQEEAEAVKEN